MERQVIPLLPFTSVGCYGLRTILPSIRYASREKDSKKRGNYCVTCSHCINEMLHVYVCEYNYPVKMLARNTNYVNFAFSYAHKSQTCNKL